MPSFEDFVEAYNHSESVFEEYSESVQSFVNIFLIKFGSYLGCPVRMLTERHKLFFNENGEMRFEFAVPVSPKGRIPEKLVKFDAVAYRRKEKSHINITGVKREFVFDIRDPETNGSMFDDQELNEAYNFISGEILDFIRHAYDYDNPISQKIGFNLVAK